MTEKTRLTADEFFEIAANTTDRLELIDGEIIVISTPLIIHQRILGRLYTLILQIKPNGDVFFAPIDVRFEDGNIPQPDLLWVSADNPHCRITDARIEGAPDLIVEVFSPSTIRLDKTVKFLLYEKHGVREYWMIDPVSQSLEAWSLNGDEFALIGTFKAADSFQSPLFGQIPLNLAELFA